jgi:hypothetical protein
MKKCRYNRPDVIASYYDGTLQQEERKSFEDHLYTCSECLESLLSLEKDLFLMENTGRVFAARPAALLVAQLVALGAYFKTAEGGLTLLKNLQGPAVFVPVLQPAARGKKQGGEYRFEKGSVAVSVKGSKEGRFDAEVSGIRGRNISLYLSDRLIEARAHSGQDPVVFYSLGRGSYRLFVEGEVLLEFMVG